MIQMLVERGNLSVRDAKIIAAHCQTWEMYQALVQARLWELRDIAIQRMKNEESEAIRQYHVCDS